MKAGAARRRIDYAATDPIGRRIRSWRLARGLSLQKLAGEVGVAASHLFHVEHGSKAPSEALASRLARALGDDEQAFTAWARLRRRATLGEALAAAPVIERYLARPDALAEQHVELPAPRPARLLVPLLPAGADPGGTARPPGAIGTLRLAAADLPEVAELDRPFAYVARGPALARVPELAAEEAAIVLTRRALPLPPGAVAAVRLAGGIVLACALWNGDQLLLLPAPGASDFIVLPPADADALARLLVGRVVGAPLAIGALSR
jgi:transcriptional regulator with XRE-family HTH domain